MLLSKDFRKQADGSSALRLVPFLLVCCLLLSLSPSLPVERASATVTSGKLAIIGDSFGSGYMLPDPSKRWTTLYAAGRGSVEINKAVPGSGYINRGAGATFLQQAQGIPVDTETVLISGGINDASLNRPNAELEAAVRATLEAVKLAAPSAQVTVISPMWIHSTPSPQLLQVDAAIRRTLPSTIPYVEGGPWLRVGRPEWNYYDGHPNERGHAVIAGWIQDNLSGDIPRGASFADFARPGSADTPFTGIGGVNLAEGTIRDARRGWWQLDGDAVLYGSTAGFLFVSANGKRDAVRSDLASLLNYQHDARIYHPGGDLHVTVGYAPNGQARVLANGGTAISAQWDGAN